MRRLATLMALLAGTAAAQEGALDPAQTEALRPARDRTAWYAFGAPFYLPETRIGLGALGGVHFALCDTCQTSSVHVQAAYTQNDQFSVSLAPQFFTSPTLVFSGQLAFGLFPDRFWGIGPDTPDDAGEAFTPRYLDVVLTPEMFVVPRRLRLGPKLHVRSEEIVSREPGRALAAGSVEGAAGSTVLGLGASVTWDSRDSAFSPTSGAYLEAWYAFYPGAIGGHRDFGRGAVDGRLFVSWFEGQVLALQARLEAAQGDPPFTLLPKLGGDRLLRGYRDGRYRDRLSAAAQAEYRFPIVWRIGGVAFVAAGEVASSVDRGSVHTLRVAGGGGVRFRLTNDGVNLRADVAIGPDGVELYMIVLEAF